MKLRGLARHILAFVSLPFRKTGGWFWRMALVPKICLILAVTSVWGFSQLKTESIKLSVPSFTFPHLILNFAWLIILGSAVVLILLIILLARRGQRKVNQRVTTQPTDVAPESTGASRAWKPEFPKIPSPGFNSSHFYTIVIGLIFVLCLYLGFKK